VRATATDVGRSVVWSLIHIRLLVQKVTKTQVCNAKNGVWLSAGLACKPGENGSKRRWRIGAIWQIRRSGRCRGGDAPVATISIATYSTGFKLVQSLLTAHAAADNGTGGL